MEQQNLNLEQNQYLENAESIDMVKMFDDCEAGFLAKKSKIPPWLMFILS